MPDPDSAPKPARETAREPAAQSACEALPAPSGRDENGPQLPLPLGHRAARGRADFLVGASNEQAVGWIDRWPDWPAPLLLLSGPEGSGKSHLADVWRARSAAARITAADLGSGDLPALLAPGALVVEDIHTLRDEAALFHLLNLAREQGAWLLLTSRPGPAALGFATPDLVSRLRAAPHAAISEPDEALLTQLVAHHFSRRGIHAAPQMVDYVVNRIDRSAAAAREIVARIDDYALRRNRRLNMALLREVLARAGE